MNVPLCLPDIGNDEIKILTSVLKSGWLAHGKYNDELELLFAEKIGVEYAITMNSCTSALEIALKASNIKGEVIVPSFTFIATANAVINSDCTPVFCDVDLETRNMTPEFIASCITKDTEAVIVVHYAGQPCRMDEIKSLCDKHSLLLIEDSAETIGARWNGKQAGSFGIGCFSFFPTKNITTAEGGMFTTNDYLLAERARAIISHGIVKSDKKTKPWHREATYVGHNYRMPNLNAALGVAQMETLPYYLEGKRKLAQKYQEWGSKHGLQFIKETHNTKANYWLNVVLTEDKKQKNKMLEVTNNSNVMTRPAWVPMHQLQFNKGCHFGEMINTEWLYDRIVNVPSSFVPHE